MKLSINYRHVESHKPVEVEAERHVSKLQKLLKSYSPDLVQLHGGFSVNPRTQDISCALTLSLPSGVLRATGEGSAVRSSCKKAFSDWKRRSRSTKKSCARITNGSGNAAPARAKLW